MLTDGEKCRKSDREDRGRGERMEARLTKIDRAELLRFLGYRGSEIPDTLLAEIGDCESRMLAAARPRAVWKLFDLLPDGTLAGCAWRPGGGDIRRLLSDCGQVILMAATLGSEAESLIRRAQKRSMAEAVLLDAAGSAAIENVCDNLCADLAERFAPRYLTDRFSPGYGDMPLADQAPLFQALDVTRRIGVTLSGSSLMLPQKSVTALIGVSDRPQPKRGQSCESCARADSCAFRKEGKSCGLHATDHT